MATRPRVFIGRADTYAADTLAAVLGRGFEALDVQPARRIAAKCNWVLAHHQVGRHCYTRPEVVRQALAHIFARNPDSRLTFIGNSGAGVPTAVVARRAEGDDPVFRGRGYFAFHRLFPGRIHINPTDEGTLCRYRLSLGPQLPVADRDGYATAWSPDERYWDTILTSKELLDAEQLIWFPKLKTNVLGQGLTGACKLGGIGLLLDEARMDGHNFHNDRRIADMMEIARPDLIVTDAIEVAWGGNQMTEPGKHLGIILMADNPVAHDVVACHIFGLDVSSVKHVQMTGERGWGPLSLSDIEVVTEVPLEELRARVATFGPSGYAPVDGFGDMFKAQTGRDFPLEILSGPPYEHAGAQGVLLDWLYMSYDFPDHHAAIARWPAASVVVGEYAGRPRHAQVYCVGKRASVRFSSQVQSLRTIRVPPAIHAMLRGPTHFEQYRTADGLQGWAIHMPGDPPTHRDFILGFLLGSQGRMAAPLFRLDLVVDSYLLMLATHLRRWLNNPHAPQSVEAASIRRMQPYRPQR